MSDGLAQADINAFLAVAQRIADGADRLLLEGWGKAIASKKADGSLVTQTDHAVDTYITAQLTAAYPDHAILSEELNTSYDPVPAFTWVVDPLDGTTNFARGLPIWGVSIALLWHGEPCLGLLSFCLLHERYAALSSGGATLNGSSIQTSPRIAADDQDFLMLCTRTPRRYRMDTPLKPRILGSAAYHIAAVANGSALAGIEATPKLWDIAAALLILTEAGGTYQRLDRSGSIFPLAPRPSDSAQTTYPLLAAANSQVLQELESSIVPIYL